MITYFAKPISTKNPGVWIIGRRLNQWGRHAGWVQHFGTLEGAVASVVAR